MNQDASRAAESTAPGRLREQLAALRESEESHRLLFESSPDAIFRTAAHGAVLAANPAACELVGRSEAEIRRIGRAAIIDCNDPRWQELAQERRRSGKARSEATLLRSDGCRVAVEISAVLFTDRNGELRSDLFVRDISGRRRIEEALRTSEARYRHLVENANDMIYACDPRGYWLHVNSDAVRRILGYREEDLVGHHFLEIIRPDWQPAVDRFYRSQFGRREPNSYLEFPVLAKDGHEHWVGQNVTLIVEQGRIERFEAIARDLTERKAAQDALQESVARSQQLVAHLSTLREEESAKIAREVHDELGGTLTALRLGLASATGRLENDAAARDDLAALMRVTDGAIDAVKRISAALRPRLLDTLGLGPAIRHHVADFARLTGLACDVKMPAEIGLSPERAIGVFRIVQESLTNIARHAHATRVAVSIRRRGDGLTVSVHDDGVGCTDMEQLRANSYGILGMRERSQQIGGRLSIRGAAGAGTTVRLGLALHPAQSGREGSDAIEKQARNLL